jgi:hypothetical protein
VIPLKDFREFVADGTVRKRAPDKNRAQSLVSEAESKKAFLELVLEGTPKEKVYPNFVIDSCYDVMIEYIRARMLLDGYVSDSHEAEISYMAVLGFSGAEVRFANELRYFRNGTKYYGRIMKSDYADKAVIFIRKIHPRLAKLVT